ncbi:MAG: GDSL-type esterase/lipase family protein [Bacteroidota bacterium]|nr:GDSL-type esterase/lipase family protein [Bacteroidota bacterium]
MSKRSVLQKIGFIFLIVVIFADAQPAKIRIACIGNSITWGGLGDLSYPQQLQKKLGLQYDVRNYGISARTLLKNGDFPYWKEPEFIDARNFDPHIVIIKLGTNDSKPQNWIYKDQFFGDYMELVAAFRMLHRRPQIYVCFPVPVFQTNWGINEPIVKNEIIPLIDSVRKSAKTFLIDFYSAMKDQGALFPDGVHPNAIGYEKMAQLVYDTVMYGQSGVIRYFYAQKDTLHKNETTTLYWNTSENSKAFLNGNPVNAVDSLAIVPTSTAAYTLTTQGMISDSISRTVFYYPPGKIKLFRPSILSYEIGSVDSITLFWQTGTGSSVSLNGISVKENDALIVPVRSDTMFTLRAVGEVTDTQIIHIEGIETEKYNRALMRRATASTTDWGFSVSSVNDGDSTTYWKSVSGKTQWISIDFGKTISINKAIMRWGKVCATNYYLLLTKESGETEPIYNNSIGDGGVDDISEISGIGRQLKILFLNNSTLNDSYILNEVEVFGTNNLTSVDKASEQSVVKEYTLEQNFPNPFNPTTDISYQIPVTSTVSLKVYNILGKEIDVIVNKEQEKGRYSVRFNGSRLASGLYFYTLRAGNYFETKMMALLK